MHIEQEREREREMCTLKSINFFEVSPKKNKRTIKWLVYIIYVSQTNSIILPN